MTKTETKLIRLAAVAAVIFFLMKRSEKKDAAAKQKEEPEPYYPDNIGKNPARKREFNKRYLVFVVDGRTYYAHKSGEYANYALSPVNNRALKKAAGKEYFYPYIRIAPENVQYNGKKYKVLIENSKPIGQTISNQGLGSVFFNALIPELFTPEMLDE